MYIQSFSAILDEGIYSPGGLTKWPTGQNGPIGITREQVLAKPYPAFGKLCLADKLAFCAASIALSSLPSFDPLQTGICLALPFGSLSTDLRYMESVLANFPSPALFSATLPSSAVADIAIFFGIKGENRVFAEGADAGYTALENAFRLLHNGKCGTMLVLQVIALEEQDMSCALLQSTTAIRNKAFAVVLSTQRQQNAVGMCMDFSRNVPNKDMPAAGGELYFDSLIQLLHTRSAGIVNVTGSGIDGRFLIAKDQFE